MSGLEFKISDDQLQRVIIDACRDKIASELRSSYGPGAKLGALVARVIDAERETLAGMITQATRDALSSPEFQAMLRAELLRAISSKFKGTFDGVLHAAAKKAANNKVLRDSIVSAAAADLTQETPNAS